jgi:uncharacterized membrane protein YbhN (UPF0104 family)
MATSNKADVSKRPIKARVLVLIVFLLLLYIVLPQADSFAESFSVLRSASWGLTAAAAVLVVATYIVASATYQLLAVKKLHYGRTLLVQGASAFANRILPAGLGGLTLNVQYLRKQRHTLPQAIAVAGVNNTLGFVGHMLVLAAVLLVTHESLTGTVHISQGPAFWYAAIAAAGILGVVLFVATGLRRSVFKVLYGIIRQFVAYRKQPARLVGALVCSMSVTLLYVAIFYLAAHAVGVSLSVLQALLVFTAGIVLGTVTPTPGGLGGVEAGLVAGTVAYGYSASLALAAALLFRLLTYWVPLLPGFILFMRSRKYYA